MAVIKEGIRANGNSISFGDYSVSEKLKINGFDFMGDIYKLRSHDQVTRLEKNDELLIEAVPGAAFHSFTMDEREVLFQAEGAGDVQITMGLLPEAEYKLIVNDVNLDKLKTNRSGKFVFSLQLNDGPANVKIEKV